MFEPMLPLILSRFAQALLSTGRSVILKGQKKAY